MRSLPSVGTMRSAGPPGSTPPCGHRSPRVRLYVHAEGCIMRKTVTAGIDGSAESNAAARWAAREAILRGAPLTLLQAGYEPTPRTHLPEIDVPAERVNRALDHMARRLLADCPGLQIVPRRTAEAPVTALLAAAETSVVLAMGSRGFSSLAGFMIGSVTLDVTAQARGPVVLVRAGERAEEEHAHAPTTSASERTAFRPVVLGLDPEHPGEELLSFAFEAAKVRATSLTAVYARKLPAWHGYGPTPTAEADTLRNETRLSPAAVLHAWREKYPDVSVTERLAEERAAHGLLLAAENASLVVVGHRVGTGTRIGPVTHAMIHHAACPVAVVPHPL
ncbi:universal stress protein [Streptomyces sp. NPDC048389]|uniref:universal stress protein n=1 Tax=Streptomyces sp. NPDC048389 TaxID=3154622 RepID=UPI0034566904